MRKTVLFLLLAIITVTAKAQEDFLIPTAGMNISGVALGNDTYNLRSHTMMKFGFIGGFRYQHQFKKPYLVEVGVLYNESGFIFNHIPDGILDKPLDKIDVKLNYISMPLMFGYRFGRADRAFSVAPKIGVQLGYLVDSREKFTYNCVDFNEEFDTKNKFDVAEVIEVEFSWIWGKRVCSFLSLAQRYSFTNLNSGDDDMIINKNLIMHNHQLSVNVGLRIKLNKMQKSIFDD